GRGPVELDQSGIDRPLIFRVHAEESLADGTVDVLHGPQHALAAVPLPAVAEFESLVFAGRGTRGNRCPAHVSRDEFNLRLDGGIAPAVEDLPGTNVDDLQHLAAP